MTSRTNERGAGSREIENAPTLARSPAIATIGRATRDDSERPLSTASSSVSSAMAAAIAGMQVDAAGDVAQINDDGDLEPEKSCGGDRLEDDFVEPVAAKQADGRG